MSEENVSKPHRLLNEARSLFNNPKWSDVRFLVEGQTVYGHKLILATGSPAFERMFFGELKEDRDVIEITDLSLIGFKNALRYIYGFEIDFEFSELYESYLAADKYLLHEFGEEFFDYVKRKLNTKSSCLIYDQLIKIQKEEIPLANVRSMIIENSQKAFESEHFKQIDQETLISLLSLDKLSVIEIDLVAAVSKWVDCEVQRQGLPVNGENRRRVFEPVKGYILFNVLTPDTIAGCKEIAELLTPEELAPLLLHLLDKANPLMIEFKTPRRAGASNPCSVFVSDSLSANNYSYSRDMYMIVNRRVSIHAIHSSYSESAANLIFWIENIQGTFLNVKTDVSLTDGKWSFSINPPFDVEPNVVYKLRIAGDGITGNADKLSMQNKLNFKDSVSFHLFGCYGAYYHCVRGLEFSLSN